MSSLKFLTAAVAAASFGLVFAQGTPPQPASDPAVGAGQQSTQSTPMGSTGTPGGSGTAAPAAAGSTAGSTAAPSGAMSSGSTAGATSGSTSGSATMDTGTTRTARTARADRN